MTLLNNLEQRIRQNPKSLLFAHIADIYLKEGKVDEAVALCEQGVTYHPSYTTGHYILAKAYLSQGDQDRAETEFKTVLSHDRNFLTAHKYLGDIMARSGWENKAAIHYRDLLRIDPLEEEARAMLKSFSIEEPLLETGFHETVPSRSEEELRLGEKTTDIRKKDWEEEFDELFKSDIDTDDGTGTGGPEAEQEPLFKTDDPVPAAETEEEAEEFIDLSAFDDSSAPADDGADTDTDSFRSDSAAGSETVDEQDEPPLTENSESLLLDVSLNDMETVPADTPSPDKQHTETAEPRKPGVPAGEFDDLDLSAFEKIDEMFSREEIEPDTGDPSPDLGTSLFEAGDTALHADETVSTGEDAETTAPEAKATDEIDGSAAGETFLDLDPFPAAETDSDSIVTETPADQAPEDDQPEGIILDIPETDAAAFGADGSADSGQEKDGDSVSGFTFGEPETDTGEPGPVSPPEPDKEPDPESDPLLDAPSEPDPSPEPQSAPAPLSAPQPQAEQKTEPAPLHDPEPEQERGQEGEESGPKIVSPTLGEIYAAQGQYAKARKVFEQLSALHPDNEQYKQKIEEMRKKAQENS